MPRSAWRRGRRAGRRRCDGRRRGARVGGAAGERRRGAGRGAHGGRRGARARGRRAGRPPRHRRAPAAARRAALPRAPRPRARARGRRHDRHRGGGLFARTARRGAGRGRPVAAARPAAPRGDHRGRARRREPLRPAARLAGTVRDLLLGLRVVGADGALVTAGGRVVKNVAGYDLPKLHVGALGSVGVIVEATFKVRPRPACEEAVALACPEVRAAADAAIAVRDAVEPLWLEVDGTTVFVGLGGLVEEVAEGRAAVRAVAAARGLEAVVLADGSAVRARLAAFPTEPAAAVLRAAVLPLDLGATLADVEAAARAEGACVRWAAHASCGVVRVAVAEPAAVAPLVGALRPRIAAREGTLVVERAAAAVKRGLDVWGDTGSGLDLMRRIKAAFDPAGIFAPGRFVAGL